MSVAKPYLYLVYEDRINIFDYQENHPEYQVVGIEDEFTIRGRTQGKVVFVDGCAVRWNYDGILESIEREKKIWGVVEETPEEESDIEYGV